MPTNNIWVKAKGADFIELLVIALLIEFIIIFLFFFAGKTQELIRDSVRKNHVSQAGKILINPCFVPDKTSDNREYDLFIVIKEMIKKNKIAEEASFKKIKDPKTGDEYASMYIYKISRDGKKCVLYANLESSLNQKNLSLVKPLPGGGTGILETTTKGWNGSPFYFQFSN